MKYQTFADPLGIRKGFCALIKFDVSAKSETVSLLLGCVDDVFGLSFDVDAAFVVFFERFAGVSLGLVVVCFCICLHFALLFLNQTFK